MPVMDGLEATRIIRQRWPDSGPKIIAITAYALEGDGEKVLKQAWRIIFRSRFRKRIWHEL